MGHSEFIALKDTSTSTHRGEGLSTFNNTWAYQEFVRHHTGEAFRSWFLGEASKVNRLAMAVIHLSGGPSPRGTEEAVTRLLNSETEQTRNVQVCGHTIGVANGYASNNVECQCCGMSHSTSWLFDVACMYRYSKQRKLVQAHTVLVKFVPLEFAPLLATIILSVKPVEAEFAAALHNTHRQDTLSFLFTHNGAPVEPLNMSGIMGDTFRTYGFGTNMAELRHALDAFAHRLSKASTPVWDENLVQLANHNPRTSARYGRDQFCLTGIPADISESNIER